MSDSANCSPLILSKLGHTWIIDLDGTIVKHNGHLTPEGDQILPGVKEFFASLPKDDFIVIMTSRSCDLRKTTERFLDSQGIRFNHIIFDAPFGERVIINDEKPSGLRTAYAHNQKRNEFRLSFRIDESL